MRVIVTAQQLRLEYHPAGDGTQTKTPDDQVTVDLKTRRIVHFAANDIGSPKAAVAVRMLRAQAT